MRYRQQKIFPWLLLGRECDKMEAYESLILIFGKWKCSRGDYVHSIINTALMVLVLICWILLIIKLIIGRCAEVRTVKATVVDKYMPETVTNYPGSLKPKRYIVVFSAEDKKLSFDVSEFSYESYRIGEKGRLKYKGNRIISFR